MQLKALAVLCLVLCAQAFAVRDFSGLASRSLKQGSSTNLVLDSGASSQEGGSASAGVEASISLVGPGSVNVFASARAIAVTQVRNAFVQDIAEAVEEVEGGGFAIAIAEVEARAYAFALAEAIAESAVNIESDAAGASACASATADAAASATAFAQILVEVLAQASSDISFASASAAVEAVVSATVSAFASASSQACGTGVFSADTYIDVLANAVAVPYIDVVALALALVTPNAAIADIVVRLEADVLQVSTVDGRTASAVVGQANASSGGGAGTDTQTGP